MTRESQSIPKVAYLLHKKTFSLENNSNKDGEDYIITSFPVKIHEGIVYIGFAD